MKHMKRFLSITSLMLSVASATLQIDGHDIGDKLPNAHSHVIAYNNPDAHILLPTADVVALIQNYNWPSDANFSIALNAVTFSTRVNNKLHPTTIFKPDFDKNLWPADYKSRNFEFLIYPSDVNIEKKVGYVVLEELKTPNYSVFFDVQIVSVDKEYGNRGLASKALNSILRFCDQNPQLGCRKLSIVPGSGHDKVALIYGRQGFWPYNKDNSAAQLRPMLVKETAEYFFNTPEYEKKHNQWPLMIRYADTQPLPLSGRDTQSEILAKLLQIV